MVRFLKSLSEIGLTRDNKMIVRNSSEESSSSHRNVKTDFQISKIENSLQNWSIPNIKKCEIYEQRFTKFFSNDNIHCIEYSYPGTKANNKINLLDKSILDKHIEKGFNFIHLGLVQVAAKPNYRLGVNTPIMIMLRDLRLKQVEDSIIAILESNLHDGPAFFNCYPNFSMDLNNEKTSDSLKLYVKIPDNIVDEESGPFQIIYRVYYKVSKLDYDYRALRASSRDETILVEANLRKSSVQVPKRLAHSEVMSRIPEDWLLEDVLFIFCSTLHLLA